MPKSKQKFKDGDEGDSSYLKVSKKNKNKINVDGHFGGKNRQMLDKDGKALDDIQALREDQRLKGNELNIVDEEMAASQNKKHGKKMHDEFLQKVKKQKDQHVEEDEAAFRARLKEKRLKKKRMNMDRDSDDEDQGEADAGVQLASYSSENGGSNQAGSDSESD